MKMVVYLMNSLHALYVGFVPVSYYQVNLKFLNLDPSTLKIVSFL